MSISTTTKATKATLLAQLQTLLSGLQAKLPNGSFTVASTVYTTAMLVQGLTALISALTILNTAQAAAQTALVALDAENAKFGPVIKAVKRMLILMYANAPDALAVFGLKPPKARVPLTSAQRAVRAAKAEATRIARGTASKKQKAAIKGNVAGVTITPLITPPAAPQPVASQPASPPVAPSPVPSAPVAAQAATSTPPVTPNGHSGS